MHLGHLDILQRAAQIFNHVVVAVPSTASTKPPLFTAEERLEMVRAVTAHLDNVSTVIYTGLTVLAAKEHGCRVIVRGMRALTDFEYEFQMGMMNRKLAPAVDTMFLMASLEVAFISSTLIKDIARNGGDVRGLVPPSVAERLLAKYGQPSL